MILVDTSVLIDYLNGTPSPEALRLEELLTAPAAMSVVIGDLILMELLQGLRSDRDALRVQAALTLFHLAELGGVARAISAARNCRRLRALGVMVRKPIDCLIATYCIEEGIALLHRDRDFEPFVEHLGLATV